MSENYHSYYPFATFVLRGKDLDPRSITELIGINPSRSFKRGDKRTETKEWPHGYWELTSSGQVPSSDLQMHIKWLIDQLDIKKTTLIEILQDKQINGSISCFWILPKQQDGLALNSQLLEQVASLKLSLILDIYCPDLEGSNAS